MWPRSHAARPIQPCQALPGGLVQTDQVRLGHHRLTDSFRLLSSLPLGTGASKVEQRDISPYSYFLLLKLPLSALNWRIRAILRFFVAHILSMTIRCWFSRNFGLPAAPLFLSVIVVVVMVVFVFVVVLLVLCWHRGIKVFNI
ncbi:hypothetical protein BDW75DRAFT_56354 [Aspergillus navahoensis]